MVDCNTVRSNLFKHYGTKIICRVGSASRVEYNATKEKHTVADIAVYIHSEQRIAVVWNLEARRKNNHTCDNLSVSCDWENVLPDRKLIHAYYKRMGTYRDAPWEKVLILDVDILNEIYEYLYSYLQVNSCDKEYPGDIKCEDVLPIDIRERVSTSRWERDYKFRSMVLERYKYMCAICRCDEPQLLQAAHIKAVADGGKDTIENGICLCANHHIMLDKDLLKINYKTNELSYVDNKIQKMSWYNEFMRSYNGKILY